MRAALDAGIEVSAVTAVDDDWDEFVARCPGDVLAQTTWWAAVKAPSYRAVRVVARRDGHVVGGAQLLVRRVGPGATIAYVPKGPLVADSDLGVATVLLDEITRTARRLRVRALIVQPAEPWPELDRLLAADGFEPSPVDVGTTATIEIDLSPEPEHLLSATRSTSRRNIRKAERAGVTVRLGERRDLATFAALHRSTADRQGFRAMTLDYLERQWDELHERGVLELFLAEHDGEPVAGATVTAFGDRAVFKLAGWASSDTTAALRPNDLLHWRIMEWARAAGLGRYDLGGFDRDAARLIERGEPLPDTFRSSPSQFKLGFGGRPVTLPTSVWRLSPAVLRPLQPLGCRLVRPDSMARRAIARLRSE